MKLFTPGPVSMRDDILSEGGVQHSYFRTESFSNKMLFISKTIKDFIYSRDSKIVPLAASGTGAMDCAVSNLIDTDDRVMIINNGTFGERWVDLCDFYNLNYYNYKVDFGTSPNLEDIENIIVKNEITVILTQATETSSAQKIPIKEIGFLTKKHNVLFIVDAITAFLIDEFYMDDWFVDVSILSSQKGFCVPPGMSFLVLGKIAIDRLSKIKSKSYYFNIKVYLENMERGQTPFSPPVTLVNQIVKQLNYIKEMNLGNYLSSIDQIAIDLRRKMISLPFQIISDDPSNCLTTYRYNGENDKFDAYKLFIYLADNYNYYITPVGGHFTKTDIRIVHIGDISVKDNELLVNAISTYLSTISRTHLE